jgi:hypothetical protein
MESDLEILNLIFEKQNDFTETVDRKVKDTLISDFVNLRGADSFKLFMKFLKALQDEAIEKLRRTDSENSTFMATMQTYSYFYDITERFVERMTKKTEVDSIGKPQERGPHI